MIITECKTNLFKAQTCFGGNGATTSGSGASLKDRACVAASIGIDGRNPNDADKSCGTNFGGHNPGGKK